MTYNAKVYREQGGDKLVVDSGGTIEVRAGGALQSIGPDAKIGYGTGAGAAVLQGTNATTAVTINAVSGRITTVTQNFAAGVEIQFTVNNTSVVATDVVILNVASGTVGGTTIASVTAVAANSFQVTLTNLHASVAETGDLVLSFAVIKGVIA